MIQYYYRDLKDNNILITRDNVLKIADFGISKSFTPNQSSLYQSQVLCSFFTQNVNDSLIMKMVNIGINHANGRYNSMNSTRLVQLLLPPAGLWECVLESPRTHEGRGRGPKSRCLVSRTPGL